MEPKNKKENYVYVAQYAPNMESPDVLGVASTEEKAQQIIDNHPHCKQDSYISKHKVDDEL